MLAYSLTYIIITYENADNIQSSTYPYLALNITMFGLFMGYLVFFSAHLTKADRYFTAMAPGFIFIVTMACEALLSKIRNYEFKKFNLKYLIPVVMVCLMLFVAGSYLSGIFDDSLAISESHASDWISDKEGIIVSDRAPVYTWHLQKEVIYATYPGNATKLNNELLEKNATWYIGEDVNLTDYERVKAFGNVIIYERT